MKSIRFNSVLNPNAIGYEYTADSMTFFDAAYRTAGCLGGAFGYFDTYGDGNCQHTPLMAARLTHFTDFCISLAQHIIANPADGEGVASYHFGFSQMGTDTVKFLASLVYKQEKRQWFNWQDLKLSASDSKEHDKRWTRVPAYADGTIASAFRLAYDIRGNRTTFMFERYALETLFWDTLYSQVSTGHDEWEKITSWRTELAGDHCQAFKALRLTVEGMEGLSYAKRLSESARYNSTPAAEKVA